MLPRLRGVHLERTEPANVGDFLKLPFHFDLMEGKSEFPRKTIRFILLQIKFGQIGLERSAYGNAERLRIKVSYEGVTFHTQINQLKKDVVEQW